MHIFKRMQVCKSWITAIIFNLSEYVKFIIVYIMNIGEGSLLLAQKALSPRIGQTLELHMRIVDFL